MQSSPPPFSQPMSPTPPPTALPPAKKGRKLLAVGCGVPLGILVLLLIIGSLFGPSKKAGSPNATVTNAPQGGNSLSGPGNKGATTTPIDTKLAAYTGKWQGADGTSVWIRGDGKGDYDGGNTKVQGGGVTVDGAARTLAITSFFGLGKTWNINQPPKRVGDHTEMTLDNVVYQRTGNQSVASNAPTTNVLPTAAAQDKLVQGTLTLFDQGLGTQNFSAFYDSCAYAWKQQTDPVALKGAFKEFLAKKIRLTKTLSEIKPVYAPARIESNGMLRLQGFYPSRPARTYFILHYLNEGGAWKLATLEVNVGRPLS